MYAVKEKLLEALQELDALDERQMEPHERAADGIKASMKMVNEFHEKLSLMRRQRVRDLPEDHKQMPIIADELLKTSEYLSEFISSKDCRPLRHHLHIEEEAELADALIARDEVKVLDALTDKLYVILGTASILDLPLAEAFAEVHASNMTKEKQPDDVLKERVRDKGPNYRPPDLAKVLADYRREQFGSHDHKNGECVNCGMSTQQIFKQIDKYGRGRCKGWR